MQVENVSEERRSGQGLRSVNCGPFSFWGDKVGLPRRSSCNRKAPGMNWSDQTKRGYDSPAWLVKKEDNSSAPDADPLAIETLYFEQGLKVGNASARTFSERRALAVENPEMDPHNFWHNSREDGAKNGGDWFGSGANCSLQRKSSSRSNSRKAASAMIAKIPFLLAAAISPAPFKPQKVEAIV